MEEKKRFLMSRPDEFGVNYEINPWMNGNIGRTEPGTARQQWEALYKLISERADVELINSAPGQPDMLFTANAGLVLENNFILSHFSHPERQGEEPHFRHWFEAQGFTIHLLPEQVLFEGGGDALFHSSGAWIWAAYGERSSLESHLYLANIFQIEVVSLRLVDHRFYHLDTCLLPLPDGGLLFYPSAFDERSRREIRKRTPAEKLIEIDSRDAENFAANAAIIGDEVILNFASERLKRKLATLGLKTITTPLSEFIKAGGSARCLTLPLDEPISRERKKRCSVVSRRVEIHGQLLDSLIVNRICDTIINGGGSFTLEQMQLGRQRNENSQAEIELFAPSSELLESIVQQVISEGAELPAGEERDAVTASVERDGCAPDNFHLTTIYETTVRIAGRWVTVSDQRMDGMIVINNGEARCELLRNLKAEDEVVVGNVGIRIIPPRRANKKSEFGFMSAGVSSERHIESVIEELAWELERIRRNGGRIVVVAGPVVIHTGGAAHLAWLAEHNYLQALLGGNATAVHDIENALFGTSLGVELRSGHVTARGHRNHIAAINRIRRAGSIAGAVKSGELNRGLFYELTKREIPFLLAGSIRDDGPLPDTDMDLIIAQEKQARLLKGADLVLMLSSMLHSIGAGNMIPASTRLFCVDINPAVVTKLADRGSLEATGVVTDVGLFLERLIYKLKLARETNRARSQHQEQSNE